MSEIPPIGAALNGPVHRATPNGHAAAMQEFIASPAADREGDRVELSDRALFLERMRDLSPARRDVVARMREAIASGSYPLDEHVHEAVDRMIEHINR